MGLSSGGFTSLGEPGPAAANYNATLAIALPSACTPAQVVPGGSYVCVLCVSGRAACWGEGLRIGSEDTNDVGLAPGDMGNGLAFVDFGTSRTVKQLYAGVSHTCAILDDDSLKCFGDNNAGELGLGVPYGGWGMFEGQMGDGLPVVDLGPDVHAVSASLGWEHTCVLLNTTEIKCFGMSACLCGGARCSNPMRQMISGSWGTMTLRA